jgi:hypothetical protein
MKRGRRFVRPLFNYSRKTLSRSHLLRFLQVFSNGLKFGENIKKIPVISEINNHSFVKICASLSVMIPEQTNFQIYRFFHIQYGKCICSMSFPINSENPPNKAIETHCKVHREGLGGATQDWRWEIKQ